MENLVLIYFGVDLAFNVGSAVLLYLPTRMGQGLFPLIKHIFINLDPASDRSSFSRFD